MITLLFALSFSHPAAAEPARLTLGAYLDQVARRSPGAIAARLHSSGGVSRAEGASGKGHILVGFQFIFCPQSTARNSGKGFGIPNTNYTVPIDKTTPCKMNSPY